MKNEIELSIIIPVYNVEKYVNACLRSVIEQNDINEKVEVIIVDDGSTDNSLIICKQYERANVYVYKKKNGGLSDARNFGIDKARGKYIWFIDGDDYISSKSIRELLDRLRSNPDVLVIQSKATNENGYEVDECKYSIVPELYPIEKYLSLLLKHSDSTLFCAQYHICKKELLNRNCLYFERGIIHEDELWTPQILLHAQTVYYSGLNIYHHVMRDGSIMHSSKKEKSAKCIQLITEKLFEIYANEQKLNTGYLYERIVAIYLQAACKAPRTICADAKMRMKLLIRAKKFKTRVKSALFLVSPEVYMLMHRMTKGVNNDL